MQFVNMPFMVFSLKNLAAVIVRATKHSIIMVADKNASAQKVQWNRSNDQPSFGWLDCLSQILHREKDVSCERY